jgi:hypothetical protein
MNKNLTPKEHWELHQGLWTMLGCDMELYITNKTTAIYIDNKTNKQYNYSTLGKIEEKKLDANKS